MFFEFCKNIGELVYLVIKLAQFSPSTLLLFSISKFIMTPFRYYCKFFQIMENNIINIKRKKQNQPALLMYANIYLSNT